MLYLLHAERSILSTVGIFDQTCHFINNTISQNSVTGLCEIALLGFHTGLHLEGTVVDFHGDSFIVGNNIVGGLGGGMRILHDGFARLWHDGTLIIANNSADFGGGI